MADEIKPITHLEHIVADTEGVDPITHLEKVINEFGGGTKMVEDLPTGSSINPKIIYHLTKDVEQGGVPYEKGLYYYDQDTSLWVKVGVSAETGPTFVGNVKNTTAHMPSTRPGGGTLVNGDYVKIDPTMTAADLPFTIDGVTFNNLRDQAIYLGSTWVINATAFQNTAETPLKNPVQESLNGTATTQNQSNKQFVDYIKAIKTVTEVTTLPTTDIKQDTLYRLTAVDGTNIIGYYYHNGTAWTRIADDTKLDKLTVGNKVYVTNGAGGQSSRNYTIDPAGNAFPVFSANKTLKTNSPVDNNDSANKEYVDNLTTLDDDTLKRDGTTHKISAQAMTGATEEADGKAGIVPKPLKTDKDKYLKGDGTWAEGGGGYEPDDETIKLNDDDELEAQTMVGASPTGGGKAGIVPTPGMGDRGKYLRGDGSWANTLTSVDGNTIKENDSDEIYAETMTGASASAHGYSGIVPRPEAGDNTKFLKGDGTWAEVDIEAPAINLTTTSGTISVADLELLRSNDGAHIRYLDMAHSMGFIMNFASLTETGMYYNCVYTDDDTIYYKECNIRDSNRTYTITTKEFSSASSIAVGEIDEDSTAFPTTRPGGSSLVTGDYVTVKSTATVPFTLGGITFNSLKDKATWSGSAWVYAPFIGPDTSEVTPKNAAAESLSGDATTQAEINEEFAEYISDIKSVTEVTTLPTGTSIKKDTIYHLTNDYSTYEAGYYYHNGTAWVAIATGGGGATSVYRGTFADRASIPTNANGYRADKDNKKTPTTDDFITVDSLSPAIGTHFRAYRISGVELIINSVEFNISTEGTVAHEVSGVTFTVTKQDNIFTGKANKPMMVDGNIVPAGGNLFTIEAVSSEANFDEITAIYDGAWFLVYEGTWADDGVSGWKPKFALGQKQHGVDGETIDVNADDELYAKTMTGASSTAGKAGIVPKPEVADKDKFLKGDGTWDAAGYEPDDATIKLNSDDELEAQEMTGASASSDGTSGIAPKPESGDQNKFLRGDGTWAEVSGGGSGMLVGTIDDHTAHLPNKRPDDSDLEAGDYVIIDPDASVPFTVDSITFTNIKDKANWGGTAWAREPYTPDPTGVVTVSDPSTESLSGLAQTQSAVNIGFKNRFIEQKSVIRVTTLPTTDIKQESLYHLTDSTATYPAGYYYSSDGAWVRMEYAEDSITIDADSGTFTPEQADFILNHKSAKILYPEGGALVSLYLISDTTISSAAVRTYAASIYNSDGTLDEYTCYVRIMPDMSGGSTGTWNMAVSKDVAGGVIFETGSTSGTIPTTTLYALRYNTNGYVVYQETPGAGGKYYPMRYAHYLNSTKIQTFMTFYYDNDTLKCMKCGVHINTGAYTITSSVVGGGGGGGMFVGTIDDESTQFPDSRPGGASLQAGDYVVVDPDADVPFTLSGVTFNTIKDKGVYGGSDVWTAEPYIPATSDLVNLKDGTDESLSGTATNQAATNQEFAEYIKAIKSVTEVTTLPTSDIKQDTIYHLTAVDGANKIGYYYHNGTTWAMWPNGYEPDGTHLELNSDGEMDIKDGGVTKVKIASAAKVTYTDDTQTLKNKTLDADENTFTNLPHALTDLPDDATIKMNSTTHKIYAQGMVGATASANGTAGIVPRPNIADKDKFLKGDGTWAESTGGGIQVGTVDEDTSAFPTTRPGGDPLVPSDYVAVDSDATLPFTIDGITFVSNKDKASWNGSEWVYSPFTAQDTQETILHTPEDESLSGEADNQAETNEEFVEAIQNILNNLSHVGDVIFSTALDTEAKVKNAKGGTAWTLISDTDGVYQWERTA